MHQMVRSVRMLIGLGMVLGMLMIGPAAPASASHGARITIHYAQCGTEVQDLFGECHDNRIAGVSFSVAGVTRATDANGVVSWTPGAGERLIVQDEAAATPPGSYVFCSNEVTGEILQDGPILRKLTITTTAGQAVICDWYQLIPDDVTLTVYKSACPAGYEGDDYYADCSSNPEAGVEFAAVNTKSDYIVNGTTDGNGFVTFQLPDELAGDLVNIREVASWQGTGFSEPPFAVYCTKNGGQPVAFHVDTIFRDPGGHEVYEVELQDIAPGDQIHCDWFNLL